MINIVLHEPEIALNTGNIGRTCVATGSKLHLIDPLGFHLNDAAIKRSGMDYWKDVDYTRYYNYKDFLEQNPGANIWFATTKAEHAYSDVEFHDGDFIMFGKESAGIPEEILVDNRSRCIRIPMAPDTRSLNLANSVAIILYEALRQQNFAGLEEGGHLHHLSWKED